MSWSGGIPVSDWDEDMGALGFDGLLPSIPNTVARLSANLGPQNYNLSGMGPGEYVVSETQDSNQGTEDGIVGFKTLVKDLSLPFFHCQLVCHFSIIFIRNLIKWPRHRQGNHITLPNIINLALNTTCSCCYFPHSSFSPHSCPHRSSTPLTLQPSKECSTQ